MPIKNIIQSKCIVDSKYSTIPVNIWRLSMPCDFLFQGQMDRIARVLQWWNEVQQSAVKCKKDAKEWEGGKKDFIFFLVSFCFVLCIDSVDVYVINLFHLIHSLLSTSIGC